MFMFKHKHTMTVKTITITEEAYDALKNLKTESESFSEGILRVSDERRGNLAQFLGILKHRSKELNAMKERIRKRRMEIDKEARERSRKIRERLYGHS